MSMEPINDTRRACADLVTAFAFHVDHRQFDKAVALFTEDGCFERPDLTARGHAELAAIWASRPESVITCHLCQEPFFLAMSDDSASSVTIFALYMTQHEGEGFAPLTPPVAIAEFHDEFRRIDGAWRIARRRSKPVLVTPR